MSESVVLACGHTMNFPSVIATGAGVGVYKGSPDASFQLTVSGTGAVTATIRIEASNDNVHWLDTPLATVTLSGTTSDTDGFVSQNASWKFVRMNVTALTGTGATVSGIIGN